MDAASSLQRSPCVAFRTGWTTSCYSVSCIGSTVTGGCTNELRVRTPAVADLPFQFTASSGRRISTAELREPASGAAARHTSRAAVFGTGIRIRYTGSRQPGRELAPIFCTNERMTGGRRGRGRAEDRGGQGRTAVWSELAVTLTVRIAMF